MAATIRDVVIRARIEAVKSGELKNSVGAGTSSVKSEEAQAIKLAAIQKREAMKLAAMAAAERRKEESHQQKMHASRMKSESDVAAASSKRLKAEEASFTKIASDRMKLLGAGAIGGMMLFNRLGPGLSGLSADLRGGKVAEEGGLMTPSANSFLGGFFDFAEEFVPHGKSNEQKEKLRARFQHRMGVRGSSMTDDEAAKIREREERPVREAEAKTLIIGALEEEKRRLVELAEARNKLTKTEDDAIKSIKHQIDQFKNTIASSKADFGFMKKAEQMDVLNIARKLKGGDTSVLSDAELEFAGKMPLFKPLFENKALEGADKGGWAEIADIVQKSQMAILEKQMGQAEAARAAKANQFNIENKITIDIDATVATLEEKVRKITADNMVYVKKVLEESVRRLDARQLNNLPDFRANAPQ